MREIWESFSADEQRIMVTMPFSAVTRCGMKLEEIAAISELGDKARAVVDSLVQRNLVIRGRTTGGIDAEFIPDPQGDRLSITKDTKRRLLEEVAGFPEEEINQQMSFEI